MDKLSLAIQIREVIGTLEKIESAPPLTSLIQEEFLSAQRKIEMAKLILCSSALARFILDEERAKAPTKLTLV